MRETRGRGRERELILRGAGERVRVNEREREREREGGEREREGERERSLHTLYKYYLLRHSINIQYLYFTPASVHLNIFVTLKHFL